MKNKIKKLGILSSLLTLTAFPSLVFAGGLLKNTEKVAVGSGFLKVDEFTLSGLAGTAVGAALGLLGIIFLSLTIYGGYLWMTAQGNEEQVSKGKKVLKNSILGLIIVLASNAIYYFVLNNIIINALN